MNNKIEQLIDEFWKAWDNLLDNGVEIIDSRSGQPVNYDDIGFSCDEDDEDEDDEGE